MNQSIKAVIAGLAIIGTGLVHAGLKRVTGAEAKATASLQEIRQSAQKGLAILEVTNKEWLQTGYCYSCHHDTLLIRTVTVARERGLPVNEQLAFESVKQSNKYLGSFDEAARKFKYTNLAALISGER